MNKVASLLFCVTFILGVCGEPMEIEDGNMFCFNVQFENNMNCIVSNGTHVNWCESTLDASKCDVSFDSNKFECITYMTTVGNICVVKMDEYLIDCLAGQCTVKNEGSGIEIIFDIDKKYLRSTRLLYLGTDNWTISDIFGGGVPITYTDKFLLHPVDAIIFGIEMFALILDFFTLFPTWLMYVVTSSVLIVGSIWVKKLFFTQRQLTTQIESLPILPSQ